MSEVYASTYTISVHYWLHSLRVGIIFRPYGRKFTVKILLFSVRKDGNQALNFAIFRPYKHWFSRWLHITVQSTRTNQLNQTDPNANPNLTLTLLNPNICAHIVDTQKIFFRNL